MRKRRKKKKKKSKEWRQEEGRDGRLVCFMDLYNVV